MSEKKKLPADKNPNQENSPDIPLMDEVSRPHIPGYQITGSPMSGSMGDIWRGVELSTKRKVAIKFMSQVLANSDRARIRFTGEVEMSAKLDYPNIARIYSCDFTARPYYYVMEWIDGVRLDAFAEKNNLTERQIIELMCRVCGAVQHAHQCAIIHRDLKPSNILVTPDGQPKVLDFGLAKLDEQDAQLSIDGELTGTPSFMSPEQARGETALIDTRADIYSLGVLLFLLLTGRNPHDTTGGAHAVIGRVANEEARTPAQVGAPLNRELCAILAKALARERQDRYGSVGELQADLTRYLAGDAVYAQLPTFSYIVGKQIQKHKKGIALAVFIMLLAAGATIAGYFRILDERNQADTARAALAANQQTLIDARDAALKQRARADELATIAQAQAQRADEQATAAVKAADQEKQLRLQLLANQQALVDAKNAAITEAEIAKKAHANELAANDNAKIAALDAKKATLAATYQGYLTNLTAVDSALDAVEPAGATRYLAACPANLQGWEWQYLTARCDTSLMSFTGHTAVVNAVAYSPDGSKIASASSDMTIRLWDASTGKPLRTFRGHTGSINSIAFSPDGSRLVSSSLSPDNTARVWDAATGKELFVLRGHTSSVSTAAFSPDGKRILTASHDKTLRIWNAETGAPLSTLTYTSVFFDASFSPNGPRVVAGTAASVAVIWDPTASQPAITLRGHEAIDVFCASFNPDGTRVVTAGSDSTVRVWDANSGKQLLLLHANSGNIHTAAFSHDGTKILVSGNGRALHIFDASTGDLLSVISSPSSVYAAAISPDDSHFVTGTSDGVVRIWIAGPDSSYPILHSDKLVTFASFIDADQSILTTTDHTFNLWDATTGKQTLSRPLLSYVTRCLAIDPAGKSVVAASSDATARVFLVKNGIEQITLAGHHGPINAAAFSPDSSKIATASADNTAKIWDAASARELLTLTGHTGPVNAVAFSPDGKLLVTASADKTAQIWDASTGASLVTLTGHTDSVTAAAFNAQGTMVVTASTDNTARIWEVTSGLQLSLLKTSSPVLTAAFSPDGSRILTTHSDHSIHLWEPQTGLELLTLRGHADDIVSASFSSDSTRILTASKDHTVRIWDTVPRQQRYHPQPPAPPTPKAR